jgi:hypothetical protein
MKEARDLTPVTNALATHAPTGSPLKADRIQLVVLVLDAANRPYDFARETEAERSARLEAGWRKRTLDAPWRSRPARDAA